MVKPNVSISVWRRFYGTLSMQPRSSGMIGYILLDFGTILAGIRLWIAPLLKLFMDMLHAILGLMRLMPVQQWN